MVDQCLNIVYTMKMTTKLQKLGNSYALIVPKREIEKMGAKAGDLFNLEVEINKLVYRLTPKKKKKYTLEELVKGITKKNRYKEIGTGYAVGAEIIDDDYSNL